MRPQLRSLLAQPYFTKDVPIDWRQGRISYYWDHRVSSLWATYFANDKEEFIKWSLFTDVTVEFNSFLVTGIFSKKSKELAHQEQPAVDYRYLPSTYMYDFDIFNPFLEQLVNEVISFPQWSFLMDLLSFPSSLTAVIANASREERELMMGKFVLSLEEDAYQRGGLERVLRIALSPQLQRLADNARIQKQGTVGG